MIVQTGATEAASDRNGNTIQKPSDESLRITTKAPSGAHGKLKDSRLMHWCTEQMTAGYKRNPAEEPTDQNRGNLLGEPRECTSKSRRLTNVKLWRQKGL